MSEAVDVPVFMSSLIQLPLISSFLGRERTLGVLTASTTALGNRVLELAGIEPERDLLIRGMQDNALWKEAFRAPGEEVDSDVIEREVVKEALAIKEAAPRLGAIVLECSLMPPYAKAVQEAVGVPVYDFMTLINYFHRSTHQRPYRGDY